MESIDKENMEGILDNFPEHCSEAMKLGKKLILEDEFDTIVVCGMGGSAVAGDILQSHLNDSKIQVYVNRDYTLPNWLSKRSLVFCLSYSGNTEETLSAFREAQKKSLTIVGISSGGKLKEYCSEANKKHLLVPQGVPPRLATPYLFFPILNILKNAGMLDNLDEAVSVPSALKKEVFKKMGQDLAKKIGNKIPIIYSSNKFAVASMKWKTDINENAKVHAFYNVYPEFNHNEINALLDENREYYIVILNDADDYSRIRKRIKITREIIRKKGIDVIEIALTGTSHLVKLFSAMYMGLWTSYFLALEHGIDPTPVKIIEELKKELK